MVASGLPLDVAFLYTEPKNMRGLKRNENDW